MSIIAELLREVPLSSLLHEKVKALEAQRDEFKRELEYSKILLEKLQEKHRALVAKHAEDVRLLAGVEFRRGQRTGGVWLGFCPKCHLPVNEELLAGGNRAALCSALCGWKGVELSASLKSLAAELQT